jgi:hypothetical protein
VLAEVASEQGRDVVVMSQVHEHNTAMLALNDKLGVSRERDADPQYRDYWLSGIRIEPDGHPSA